MALLALLSIVIVPLAMALIGFVFGRSFGMGPGAIARIALITVIMPLVAGITVRALLPGVADRLERVVSPITKVLLPLAALVLLVGSWRAMWAAVGDGSIVAIIIFVAAGLLAGHLLGGPDPENAVVLALSSACRHPAIALTIAAANLSGPTLRGDHPALSRDQRPHWCAVPHVAPPANSDRDGAGVGQAVPRPHSRPQRAGDEDTSNHLGSEL